MADTQQAAGRADRHETAARRALALAHAEPAAAARTFRAVLRAATAGPQARATAYWGLGRLAHARGEIVDAITAFTEAVGQAVDTGNEEFVAEIRVSWAACEQSAGNSAAALAQLDAAQPHLSGALLGKALTQRGFLHAVVGERETALGFYDAGLPLLLHGGDEVAALRSLLNRGTMLMQLGRFRAALADLTLAHRLADRLDQPALAAGAVHLQAYLDAKLGNTVQAARGFASARERYVAIGSLQRHLHDLDIDECEVLLEWGLGSDAVPLAQRVAAEARRQGNMTLLGEALLTLTRAELMAGRPTVAAATADEACTVFESARRPAYATLARYWALVAAGRDAASRPTLLRRFVQLRRLAEQLDRHGWHSEAAEVRMLTARVALQAGRREVAAALLSSTAHSRMHPQARVRVDAWHAAALLHLAEGNPERARRALHAGLSAVAVHRASLGAAELRSSAGQLGAPLAATGLQLALAARNPRDTLQWAERGRAGALAAPMAGGGQLVPEAVRTHLRSARHQLSLAAARREAVDAELRARVAELEAEVSRINRQRIATGGVTTTFRASELVAALASEGQGNVALIEYVESDGALHAIVCRSSGVRVVPLGAVAEVVAANDHLVFAIRRLAALPPGPAAQRAWAAAMTARADVDRLLLAPLAKLVAGRPLVVVPTGALNAVLWSALPTAQLAAGVTIAPSAAWWARRAAPAPTRARRRGVLLVAGPELAHANAEVAALRRTYPAARVLVGEEATVGRVLEAMEEASLVHIAAHGAFRADNPLFSSLQMHDGPLFVHELEGLTRTPDSVVLAACSGGRSGVLPGDELLGTTAVLMGLGVRSLVAPLLPVADDATAEAAVALHAGFRRGGTPATALASLLQRAISTQRHDLFAAAAAFTCWATSGSTS